LKHSEIFAQIDVNWNNRD